MYEGCLKRCSRVLFLCQSVFIVLRLGFLLQKKKILSLMEQELEKAREEASHQEKLREEEEKIRKALEESKKVCYVTKSHTESPFTPFLYKTFPIKIY